jgi:hypothetical protein
MDCRRVRQILFEAVDSDLPEDVQKELKRHLSECRMCSGEASAIQEELNGLSALSGMSAPGDLLHRIHERLNDRRSIGSGWERFSAFFGSRRFLELAGVTVAAMLVVVIYHVSLRELLRDKPASGPVSAPGVASAPKPDSAQFQAPAPVVRESPPKGADPPAVSALRSDVPRAPAGAAPRLKESEEPLLKLTLTLALPKARQSLDLERKSARPLPGNVEMPPQNPAPSVSRAEKDEVSVRDLSKSGRRQEERQLAEPRAEGSGSLMDRALEDIYRFVAESAGEIIRADRQQVGDLSKATVVAEILSEKHAALLNKLRGLGEIQGDEAGTGGGRSRLSRIRITLQVTSSE